MLMRAVARGLTWLVGPTINPGLAPQFCIWAHDVLNSSTLGLQQGPHLERVGEVSLPQSAKFLGSYEVFPGDYVKDTKRAADSTASLMPGMSFSFPVYVYPCGCMCVYAHG